MMSPNPAISGGGKVIIAPKLLKPAGSGAIGGSSSIYNLPGLPNMNMMGDLQPTNRGLKAMDSNNQLYRPNQEESKINYDHSSAMNPPYYTRNQGTNQENSFAPLSPNKSHQKTQIDGPPDSTRNLSVLNMKGKSSARFLSPLQSNPGKEMSTV